jgi:SAM-dependent methyltransferase
MRRLDRALQNVRVRTVKPFIGAGARILDVGCADGMLYRQVRPSHYVGIDPDAPHTAPAANARFIRDTFPTAQLDPAERFDVIVMMAVLEHVPRETQQEVAQACAAHLEPNGVLAITVPSTAVDGIIDLLKRASLLDGMREDQHYGFNPHSTPSVFEPHGFRLQRHRRFELGLNHLFVFEREPPHSPVSKVHQPH